MLLYLKKRNLPSPSKFGWIVNVYQQSFFEFSDGARSHSFPFTIVFSPHLPFNPINVCPRCHPLIRSPVRKDHPLLHHRGYAHHVISEA